MNSVLHQIESTSNSTDRHARFGLFVIAAAYMLVVFSSPMPIEPGLVEIVIGAGLVIGCVMVLLYGSPVMTWQLKVAILCHLLLLSYASLVGQIYGNGLSNMIRDIIPHVYIVAPMLIVSLIKDDLRRTAAKYFIVSLVAVGTISSIQFLYGTHFYLGGLDSLVQEQFNGYHGGSYELSVIINENVRAAIYKKNYDPAVLFSAIVFSVAALICFVRKCPATVATIALWIGMTITYGIMILGLRAHTILVVGVILLNAVLLSHKVQVRRHVVWVVLLILCVAFFTFAGDAARMQIAKYSYTGTNGKINEFATVLRTISNDPVKLLIGSGWGAIFDNPIVSASTRFTHSIISYYLLKSGVIGLALMSLSMIAVFPLRLQREIVNENYSVMIVIATCAALSVSFLQPTYKMLSFGMLLALLAILVQRGNAPADDDSKALLSRVL